MRYFITSLFLLFLNATFGQLGLDSLTINALKLNVVSDGNLEDMKAASNNKMLNYTTQLWLSAYDANDSLCVAAQMYRQHGRDFQPGPISNDTNARNLYNRVWKINRTTVDSFAAGLFAGMVPSSIASWPAHGNAAQGESFYLAPFVDVNSNGYYNPLIDGDYPCFAGDQAVFFVFNDDTIHANSDTQPLGIEVLGMVYGYSSSTFLDSVVFIDYSMRSLKKELKDFRASVFADFDLGNSIDDIVGTFIDQNTMIVYNADVNDEGPLGFGMNPPATGLTVLSGMQTSTFDGLDNDKDGCVDGVRDSNGVCQPINAAANIVESWKLSSSMYYNNTSSAVSGQPRAGIEYVRYMTSHWRMGFPLVIDDPNGFMSTNNGDGFRPDGTGTPIGFAYPGNSYDTSGAFAPMAPTNWFESPANLADKRAIASVGYSDTLSVGNELRIKVALFMARDSSTINSFDAAHAMAVKINAFVDSVPNCSGSRLIGLQEEKVEQTISLFPNPAQDWVVVSAPSANAKEGVLLSVDGRLIARFKLDDSGKATVHIGALPTGLYIIQIGENAEKLIVQ